MFVPASTAEKTHSSTCNFFPFCNNQK